MSVHISTTCDGSRTIFKVDGWLRSEDIEELLRALQSSEGARALDLSGLQSADRAATDTLRQLVALDVEVRGASPYIALLLKGTP